MEENPLAGMNDAGSNFGMMIFLGVLIFSVLVFLLAFIIYRYFKKKD